MKVNAFFQASYHLMGALPCVLLSLNSTFIHSMLNPNLGVDLHPSVSH